MASPAQLNANRLNAQRSTGPRSEEGKAVSRFNALTYGIEARSRVIPGEDSAELEALAGDYHSQFNPTGPLEAYLVETIVAADWNRRRYARVEAQLYRMMMAAQDPDESDALSGPAAAFGKDATGPKVLQSVFRQLASAERSYFRALAELRRAQKERMAEAAETEKDAAPADSPSRGLAVGPAPRRPGPAPTSSAAPQPAPIGFVSPNPPQAVRPAGEDWTAR